MPKPQADYRGDDLSQIEVIDKYTDIYQVGARNMDFRCCANSATSVSR
jgi:3-deoxy-D-arabino-heptulosonate 7-phosphate (DAHP) synthase